MILKPGLPLNGTSSTYSSFLKRNNRDLPKDQNPVERSVLKFLGKRSLQSSELPKEPPAKSLMFCTDIDGTLINWENFTEQVVPVGLADSLSFLGENQAQLSTTLNTGRGLCSWKETLSKIRRLPKELLENAPIDFLVVNNGQNIFKNKNKKPSLTWMQGLKAGDEDKRWKKALRDVTGWDLKTFTKTMEQVLTEQGFRKRPKNKPSKPEKLDYRVNFEYSALDGQTVEAVIYPDQPAFRFAVNKNSRFTVNAIRLAQAVADKIHHTLTQKGWSAEYKMILLDRPPNQELVYVFKPKAIHKAVALQYILNQSPDVKAVITAGDNDYNDTELLTHPYQSAKGQPVERFAILSGGQLEFLQKLTRLPNLLQVPVGELAPALKQHLQAWLQRINLKSQTK